MTMRNRGLRIALVGLVVALQAGAAWEFMNVGRERADGQEAARKFDANVRSLLAGLADVRAAQQAYVAEGQSAGNWFGKVTAALEALRVKLADTRGLAASPVAVQSIDAAAGLLAAIARTDGQARALIASDQRLMASDLIFGDSAEMISAFAARLGDALASETADVDQRVARTRTIEMATAGAAVAVGLVGLFLLLPVGHTPRQTDTMSIVDSAPSIPSVAPPPAPAPTPAPNLEGIAKLCGEFSRVGDPSALPELVGHAASLLNASGLIVWMANPKVGALHPALSHGYSELALARIGELSADEDNATAEAFRTGEVRVVEGGGGAHGAIAVPLVTPSGCVGVLAAEIRAGGETSKATQAIAVIVAAQLASLASASPAAA
jgi:hypothetical protein